MEDVMTKMTYCGVLKYVILKDIGTSPLVHTIYICINYFVGFKIILYEKDLSGLLCFSRFNRIGTFSVRISFSFLQFWALNTSSTAQDRDIVTTNFRPLSYVQSNKKYFSFMRAKTCPMIYSFRTQLLPNLVNRSLVLFCENVDKCEVKLK